MTVRKGLFQLKANSKEHKAALINRLRELKIIKHIFLEDDRWLYIQVGCFGDGSLTHDAEFYCCQYGYEYAELVTLDDLYDTQFLDKILKKTITVKLNSEYSAIVSKDGVEVGCQKFTHNALLELAEAIKNITK